MPPITIAIESRLHIAIELTINDVLNDLFDLDILNGSENEREATRKWYGKVDRGRTIEKAREI